MSRDSEEFKSYQEKQREKQNQWNAHNPYSELTIRLSYIGRISFALVVTAYERAQFFGTYQTRL